MQSRYPPQSSKPPPSSKPIPGMLVAIIGGLLVIIGLFLLLMTNLEKAGCVNDYTGFISIFSISLMPIVLAVLVSVFAIRKDFINSLVFAVICFLVLLSSYVLLGFLWSGTLCPPPVEIGGFGVYLSLLGALLGIGGNILEIQYNKSR